MKTLLSFYVNNTKIGRFDKYDFLSFCKSSVLFKKHLVWEQKSYWTGSNVTTAKTGNFSGSREVLRFLDNFGDEKISNSKNKKRRILRFRRLNIPPWSLN